MEEWAPKDIVWTTILPTRICVEWNPKFLLFSLQDKLRKLIVGITIIYGDGDDEDCQWFYTSVVRRTKEKHGCQVRGEPGMDF